MRHAVHRGRRSRWRYLVWLPVVVLFATIASLAAPVLFVGRFPHQTTSELRSSIELELWTLSATVRVEPAALVVDVEYIAKDEANMSPPPWPIVAAFMREHRMTERPQTRALGPTRFRAIVEPAMAGAWMVEIEADGSPLQIPVVVR